MESTRQPKKRTPSSQDNQNESDESSRDSESFSPTSTVDLQHRGRLSKHVSNVYNKNTNGKSSRIIVDINKIGKDNPKKSKNENKIFHKWQFGTINIRSGKEKDEGAKIYSVAKEVAKAKLSFCCLQEVKYLNTGNKIITLNTGEKFEFHWSGHKKRRKAGVGFLIRVDENIEISDPDIQDPRFMSMDLKIYGFNLRVINVYSPTESEVLMKKTCSTEQ